MAGIVLVGVRPELGPADVYCWPGCRSVHRLFVLVAALESAGVPQRMSFAMRTFGTLPPVAGSLSASFGVALLANVMNNLPSGLLAGSTLQMVGMPTYMRHAVLVGTDLGPKSFNCRVSRDRALAHCATAGGRADYWTFLKAGAFVVPPALFAAALALAFTARQATYVIMADGPGAMAVSTRI